MTTLLVDADITLHTAISVGTVSIDWDGPGEWAAPAVDKRTAREHFEGAIVDLKREIGAKRVVLAFSDLQCNWRKDVLPTYKANRVGPKPPGFLDVRAWAEEKWETFTFPTLEADDVLGLLATGKRIKGEKVIVTIDKDLWQIPGLQWRDGQVLEVPAHEGEWFFLRQVLTGDATDGYKGCPGVGPVKADKILNELGIDEAWAEIVKAYEKAELTEDDALVQARVARILRAGEYSRNGGVKLWEPMALQS